MSKERAAGFVDGYEAALRDVEMFRVKIAEPFDSSFDTIKGFVRDMLKANAGRMRSSLKGSGSQLADATPKSNPRGQ